MILARAQLRTVKARGNRVMLSLSELAAELLDLQGQLKVARFTLAAAEPGLIGLFSSFSAALDGHIAAILGRAAKLGATMCGSAGDVARLSKLPDFGAVPGNSIALLADRVEALLANARDTGGVMEEHSDGETLGLVCALLEELEGHAWSLRASLAS